MTEAATWGQLFALAQARLGSTIDARRILERAAGIEGAALTLALDDAATARAAAHFFAMVERRAAGEPLQYVVGQWGFRSLDLLVDPRVLIPRPETESVVDVALEEAERIARGLDGSEPLVVVDLGTGSGAIALSIATECARAEVWATDASEAALAVARANLAGLGRPATRVQMRHGTWFDALPSGLRGRVHVLVSNPPYVSASETLPLEVGAWEPREALVAGPTGLEAVAHIVRTAPAWLAPRGALVVELAPHQASAAVALAEEAGFADASVRPDLAGRPRVLRARA